MSDLNKAEKSKLWADVLGLSCRETAGFTAFLVELIQKDVLPAKYAIRARAMLDASAVQSLALAKALDLLNEKKQ